MRKIGKKFGILAATAITALGLMTGLAKAGDWDTPHSGEPGYSQPSHPTYPNYGDRRNHEPRREHWQDHQPQVQRHWPQDNWGQHDWRRPHGWHGHHATLPAHRLIRRVERQGYYDARIMGPGRFGAIRVFAYDFRHRPVMLRVDARSGQVLAIRFV